jgi:hypothetical protein
MRRGVPPEVRAAFAAAGFAVADGLPIGSLKLAGGSNASPTAYAYTRREAAVIAVLSRPRTVAQIKPCEGFSTTRPGGCFLWVSLSRLGRSRRRRRAAGVR